MRSNSGSRLALQFDNALLAADCDMHGCSAARDVLLAGNGDNFQPGAGSVHIDSMLFNNRNYPLIRMIQAPKLQASPSLRVAEP